MPWKTTSPLKNPFLSTAWPHLCIQTGPLLASSVLLGEALQQIAAAEERERSSDARNAHAQKTEAEARAGGGPGVRAYVSACAGAVARAARESGRGVAAAVRAQAQSDAQVQKVGGARGAALTSSVCAAAAAGGPVRLAGGRAGKQALRRPREGEEEAPQEWRARRRGDVRGSLRPRRPPGCPGETTRDDTRREQAPRAGWASSPGCFLGYPLPTHTRGTEATQLLPFPTSRPHPEFRTFWGSPPRY